jgi:hypothetical protein
MDALRGFPLVNPQEMGNHMRFPLPAIGRERFPTRLGIDYQDNVVRLEGEVIAWLVTPDPKQE